MSNNKTNNYKVELYGYKMAFLVFFLSPFCKKNLANMQGKGRELHTIFTLRICKKQIKIPQVTRNDCTVYEKCTDTFGGRLSPTSCWFWGFATKQTKTKIGKNSDKNQPGKAKQQKDQQDHGGVPYMRHKWILNIMHWKE